MSTLRQRSKHVTTVRDMISGGLEASSTQLQHELKQAARERHQLLQEAGLLALTHTVSPAEAIAVKADLSIPWTKLRALQRYIL